MKKIMTFAAIFAAAMMSFSACQKDDTTGKTNNGGTPDHEVPDYVSPITIDGNYADWDALDASKVAVATCADGTVYTALKLMKVYADELYINVYFEWDTAQTVPDFSDPGALVYLPVHFYINSDGNSATGGFDDHWIGADCDVMLENAVRDSEGNWMSYDPGMFYWEAPAGTNGWGGWSGEWDGTKPSAENNWGADMVEGSGIATGAGADGKYELAILREMMAGVTFGDTFTIGMDIQRSWTGIGFLPNAAATEDNPDGKAEKLSVTIDK